MNKETKRELIEHLRELANQELIGEATYALDEEPCCTVGQAMHKILGPKSWARWQVAEPVLEIQRTLGISWTALGEVIYCNDHDGPAEAITLLDNLITTSEDPQ